MQKILKNKWTDRKYILRDISGNQVTLERDDGSIFTIAMSEYRFNYVELTNERSS